MTASSPTPRSSSSSTTSEWFAPGLHFSCTQCGNCCSGPPGYVFTTSAELQDIADYLQISRASLVKTHFDKVKNGWNLRDQETPQGYDCLFLVRDDAGHGRCAIYPVRPKQCRTWPFWDNNLQSPKHWKQAARHCPGMANGLENQGTFYPIDQIRILRDNV